MEEQMRSDVVQRLRCAEGHIRCVIRMVDEDHPCLTVVQQVQAVQGALRQVNALLVTQHLDTCLRQAWHEQRPDGYETFRNEVLALLYQKD